MGSSNTTIEWTDRTWNPLRGCTRVSQGCTNCYAERIAYRFSGPGKAFEGLAKKVGNEARWTGRVKLIEKELDTPGTWTKPSMVFVNSVSDLFHTEVPDWFIDEVFLTMAVYQQHTFQVLTKRPERAVEYFKGVAARMKANDGFFYPKRNNTKVKIHESAFPLENVWIGVSVEDQKTADERIPLLLNIPAAVRFLSCEPLLGPIDLSRSYPCGYYCDETDEWGHHDHPFITPGIRSQIDWIIAGGESGPGARPAHPDWFRSLRDQCQFAQVKFFFKQWGNWQVTYDRDVDDPDWRNCPDSKNDNKGRYLNLEGGWGFHGRRVVFVRNVGKKVAGRELDGRTWDEIPEVETTEALA